MTFCCSKPENNEPITNQYSTWQLVFGGRYVLFHFVLGSLFNMIAIFAPAWIVVPDGGELGIIPGARIEFENETLGTVGCCLMYFSMLLSFIVIIADWVLVRQLETNKEFKNPFRFGLRVGISAIVNGLLIFIAIIFIRIAAPSYDARGHKYGIGWSVYFADVALALFVVGGVVLIVLAVKYNKSL